MNVGLWLGVATVVAATILAFGGVATAIPVLRACGVLDQPNHRSMHSRAIPRGAGAPLALILTCGTLVFALSLRDVSLAIASVGTLLLGLVGLRDDISSMPASVRLLAQLAVAVTVAIALLHSHPQWWLTLPVVVLWLAGFTNAYNFMDGINGISGVSALIGGAWYAYLGANLESGSLAILGLLIAGSALGFLPWNFPTPRAFLGDAGSYAIGFALGYAAAMAWVIGASPIAAVAPLLLYCADTGTTLAVRAFRGLSPFVAHREHAYQRLVGTGMSHSRTVVFVGLIMASCCLGAALAEKHALGLLLIACSLGLYLLAPSFKGHPIRARVA